MKMLHVCCVIDGITTKVILKDTHPNALSLDIRAYAPLEDEMINVGFRTHDCGCCLDPQYVSVVILSVEIYDVSM